MRSGTRVSTQSTPVSALYPTHFQFAYAHQNPSEYSEYPCEYTAFYVFTDHACTVEPV